jgi:NADH dehydrogenase/NADH:ubiquinone oxidoreductase subunit G
MTKFNKIGALTSKPYAFNARPWELKNINTIDIFDSFGSSIRLDFRDKEILRVLPRKSEWISDKVRFFYDSLKYQRFHYPYIKRNTNLIKSNFYQILFIFKLISQYVTSSSFLFKIGSLTDLESIFSTKVLNYTLLKKGNVSHLENEDKIYFNSNLQQYYLNLKDLNSCDLLLFIDLNLRFENPILNSIIRKQMLKYSNLKIFSLGSILSYNMYIKHISNNLIILKNIVNGKHKFNLIFTKATKPLILFGDSFFKRQDSNFFFSWTNKLQLLNNKAIFKHLVNNIAKLNYSELGTVSSNLYYKNNDLIINFNIGGHKNVKCNKNSIFIYQSSNYSDVALISDIILPEASFIEKESLFFTLNNGLSTTKKVYSPSKEAKEGIIFLQYFLFLLYKLTLNEEAFLITELANLTEKDFKKALKIRIFKRSLFDNKIQHSNKIIEPFLTCLLTKSSFSNVINLYYATDLLSKGSFNLTVRSKIEESNFSNFEYKNASN